MDSKESDFHIYIACFGAIAFHSLLYDPCAFHVFCLQLERYERKKNVKSVLRLNSVESERDKAQHFLLYLNEDTHNRNRKHVQELWDEIIQALKDGMHFILVNESRPEKVTCATKDTLVAVLSACNVSLVCA